MKDKQIQKTESQKKETLAQILTYAGTLPFLGAVLIPKVSPGFLSLNYDQIILTYSAVIASFIAGTHWGVYLFKEAHLNLFIHSNLVALLVWFSILTNIPGSIGILILCFFYLLFIDKQLSNAKVIEDWYMRTRLIASVIVISALSLDALL